MEKSSTKAEGCAGCLDCSPKRYIFRKPSFKRTVGWISPPPKSSKAVAAEGSVTRAANSGRFIRSNVTTRIQQLESSWAFATLFLRQGRRMVLTPAGESLRGYADACWPWPKGPARPTRAPATGRAPAPGHHGKLTAAAPAPAALAQLRAQWPDVVLDLSRIRQPGRSKVAAHGDAALVAWPPPGLETDTPVGTYPGVSNRCCWHFCPLTPPTVCRRFAITLAMAFIAAVPTTIGGHGYQGARGTAPWVLELASYPPSSPTRGGGAFARVWFP